MTDPVRASDKPMMVDVEAGQNYFWCACGLSKEQPLCDGSHAGTGISPVLYKADESKKVFFCGCKSTKSPPFCDGSHSKR